MELILSLVANVAPFLIVLTLLVYVHEMGHYMLARYNGVRVEAFSIGFGPEIIGWTNKQGTRWKISCIPLGGYVKLAHEEGETKEEKASLDPESLMAKTPWQRIAISLAGPGANYLFAIVVLAILYATAGQRVPTGEIRLGKIAEGSPAAQSGLKEGDIIVQVEGVPDLSMEKLQEKIATHANQPFTLSIRKAGQEGLVTLSVRPHPKGEDGKGIGYLGVSLQPVIKNEVHSFSSAFRFAITDTITLTVSTLKALGQIIIGKRSADGLSGPIGIATLTAEIAQQGAVALIWLMAVLSINLGLINLFPVPMLDGGHILFYLIEGIRGRAVTEKNQEVAYRIGFGVVIGLVLFFTWNDLSRLKFFQWLVGLFN